MATKSRFYGFNPPFIGGARNVLSLQTDERLIKNDLVQLLLTVPGERAYRPTFGTPIRAVVFDNVDDSQLSGLESDITSAIVRNEERVRVNIVTVTPVDDGIGLQIHVNVSPTHDQLTHYLIDIGVSPGGVQISR